MPQTRPYRIIKFLGKKARQNLDIVYETLKRKGITNNFTLAGILAVSAKETGFLLRPELGYQNTSNSRIRQVFSVFNTKSDSEIDRLKRDPEKFFNFLYGGKYGNSPNEGYKYRGRGFNGVTFKDVYKDLNRFATVDIVKNPDALNDTNTAAEVLAGYFISNWTRYPKILRAWNISNYNNPANLADAVGAAFNVTGGVGYSRQKVVEIGIRVGTWDKVNDYVVEFYDWILKRENLQPDPEAFKGSTQSQTNSDFLESTNQPQDVVGRAERTGQDPNGSSDGRLPSSPNISNIFEAEITPIEISFSTPPSNDVKKEIASTLGYIPFVWYNSYEISKGDIKFLQLNTIGNLPTLKISFKDGLNLMKDKGFPLDDSKISIFINPRTDQLRPIRMDFKIIKFNVNGGNYTMTGVIDANGLYLKNYSSLSNLTSFYAMKKIAQEVGLGFNTNLDDTDDRMTWLNVGKRTYQFIDDIVDRSYKSDESYLVSYIDFYYNLTYVDVEKELNRNIKEELGVSTFGLEEINKIEDKEKTSRLFLTNDFSMSNSNSYFRSYKIINNSTSVSLKEGYLTKAKFYDNTEKNFLVFDVDSITTPGDKIIMKGAPQDESFYNSNINLIYSGKLDKDNMHKNYHYSYTQNKRNITELKKIGLEIEMGNPNYNLIRFQKVYLMLSNQASTPSASHINNRLSGEWFIIDIIYRFDNGSYKQIIKLVKRELELSSDESSLELDQESSDSGQRTSNDTTNTTDTSQSTSDSGDNLVGEQSTDGGGQSQDEPVDQFTPDSAVASDLVVDVRYKGADYKFIVDPQLGVGGKRLRSIPADLQSFLRKNGFPNIEIKTNGIMRELTAAAVANNPARASGSLHGAGLAHDVKFIIKDKRGFGVNKNGEVWQSIFDNKNLAKNKKFTKAVWKWVQSQKDLTWGGQWGGSNPSKGIIKGWGEVEYHHFELKREVIPSYWKPYFKQLKELGFDYTKLNTTKQLAPFYQKLLGK